jgi:D-alanyl-D-alanine carboxypeptidase/D-alanyl-D-alanine-endopeptidase (penicillin-binding protein 4)
VTGRDQRHRLARFSVPSAGSRDEAGGVLWKLLVVVVVAVLGVGVAVQQGWIDVDLDQPDDPSATSPTGTEEPPPSGPGLELTAPAEPPAVLDGVSESGQVRSSQVAKVLDKAVRSKALGRHLGLVVQRLGASRPAYGVDGKGTVTPASTLKLLTSVAALDVLGPDHRFTTKVVAGPNRRSIVLVGGGDPLLTGSVPSREEAAATYPEQASLQQLARETAQALKPRGIRTVTLTYDVSLYSGPDVNPHWQASYVPDDVVSPIVPLWVDEGREVDGYSARSDDPSATAAARFAGFLAKAGVKVTGQVAEHKARASARELADVKSAPLDQVVQHVLEVSDNEGAETLLRQAAIGAGQPGSFKAGVTVVKKRLTALGINGKRLTIYDGSGLSRDDEIPIQTLVDVLQIAADPDHPQLRSVVSTLPVAGFTGSLAYRFVVDAPEGLGVVRAKTGTLTEAGVHGLAGIVLTKKGTPLLFAAVADRVSPLKSLQARDQLDVIAAQLATCSC